MNTRQEQNFSSLCCRCCTYVHRAAAERKIECDGKVQRQRLCLHLSWCWFTAHTNTHTASHGRFYFLYQDVNLHNDELLLSEIEKRESLKKKVSFEEPQGFADEDEFYVFFFRFDSSRSTLNHHANDTSLHAPSLTRFHCNCFRKLLRKCTTWRQHQMFPWHPSSHRPSGARSFLCVPNANAALIVVAAVRYCWEALSRSTV